MKDERKEKIRSLKTAIKANEDELVELSAQETPIEEEALKEYRNKIAVKKVTIQNLKQELKMVRMNKLSSSFFSFTPSGPNRQQARHYRRQQNARNS